MGTSKKIVLASFVSMLMVLGFLVGLVPNSGVSTNADTAASDQVDIVGLLDLIVGVKGVSGVTLDSPVSGVVVITPEDNAQAPEIPVPLQAAVVGDGTELVTFAANIYDDATAFPAPNNWVGDVFSDPVATPFVSALDVSSFLTGVAGTETQLSVYALVNTALANSKATALTYENANEPADALPLTIFETAGSVDGDDNALPDNTFGGDVQPGEVWISNQVINGELRTVLVANLDNGNNVKGLNGGTVFTSPDGNVQVESPDLQALINGGAIESGESGFLLVQVVGGLAGAIDVYTNGTVADWAAAVEGLQPGVLATGGQYVEVSLVYTANGGTTYGELDTLPNGLSVNLTLTGLSDGPGTDNALYSYSTDVDDVGGDVVLSATGLGTWEAVDATVTNNAITAQLTSLSIFAPLAIVPLPPVSITSASPNQVPEDVATSVTLTGVFPSTVALNAVAAAAAYSVTVGGTPATFEDVAGVAITAYSSGDNQANIVVPAISTPGFYDVVVTDLADGSNTATAAGLIEVLATSTLTTSVSGGTGVITVNPTNGSGLPVGTYFTETVVSASLVYDDEGGTKTFSRWLRNGVEAGTDPNSVSIIVGDNADDDAATTLTAELIPVIIREEYALTVNAGAGGTASAVTAPNGVNNPAEYIEDTVVTIEATANAGFEFVNWTGATVADANAANTTLTITADTTVTANFAPIAYSVNLDVSGNEGGTVSISPAPNHPNGTDYLLGTVITITATPESGYAFDAWTGADAGELADPSATTTTFTIDGSQNSYAISASFLEVINELTVTGITPNEGWIFGGVVARISGTGITDDTVISIGGQTVTGFRRFSNGTSIDVVIPASTDQTSAATVAVEVTLTKGIETFTLPNAFTYKRFQTEGGVNTTAFIVENPESGQVVDVTLNGANNDFATLEIPALDVPSGVDTVFGIARNAINGDDDDKNTGAIGALGTGDLAVGQAINGISDFSLHLYATDAAAKANTPSVGSGTLGNASGLVDFGSPVDPDGNPVASTPVLLTFPIAGSGISNGDVRNSLTLWGVQTEYDYVTEQTTVSDPQVVGYQSEILHTEVDPAITTGSADASEPNLISQARIYSLNGFSLRQGAIVPTEVAEQIRLANATGTANGDVAGGNALRIISPGGGLAHIDRIVFTEAVAGKAVGGTVSAANITTAPGTNEYEVQFTSPASAEKGIANIVIFGKADPNTPIVQLDRVFEYTKDPFDATPLLLLLLGLLVAGLGLAAGGDSGGGGGGPCFIATAAYGTPMAAQIDTLREVRDEYLLSNVAGTAFTDMYYRISPTVADAVAQSPVLAATVRVLLVPVVFLGKVAMAMPFLTACVGLSLGAFFMMRRRAGRAS